MCPDRRQLHEAPGQPLPPGFRHQGGGGAGCRRLRGGPRLFDGGRHHLLGADHGAGHLQAGGQDHPAPERPPVRHQRPGALRRGAGLREPGGGRPAGHLPGHAAGPGLQGHPGKPGRGGGAGEQPHLLRHLLRPEGHRPHGPRRRDVLPGRRGPRHPLLLRRGGRIWPPCPCTSPAAA